MFRKESDFEAFERVMVEVQLRQPIRILSYCVLVIGLASGTAGELDGSRQRSSYREGIRSSTGEHRERTTIRRREVGAGNGKRKKGGITNLSLVARTAPFFASVCCPWTNNCYDPFFPRESLPWVSSLRTSVDVTNSSLLATTHITYRVLTAHIGSSGSASFGLFGVVSANERTKVGVGGLFARIAHANYRASSNRLFVRSLAGATARRRWW